MPGITLVGLGPGDPRHLTLEAWDVLRQADEVYLRTRHHPAVAALPVTVRLESFDTLYEEAETFEEVYQAIVQRVWELAQRPEGVVYAVPGHPLVGETTGHALVRRAQEEGVPVRIVEGMSFLAPVFRALGVDPFPRTALVDALELARRHVPSFPPNFPALVVQLYAGHVASNVKLCLMHHYPDEHPVVLVHKAGLPDERVEEVPLYALDRSKEIGVLTTLYVPPLEEETAFESFQEVIARLRAPDGCPWDRKQTHRSLRPFLLEETYEVLEALDREDSEALKEELGDLLLQILLHTQIATEEGEFTMPQVIATVVRKMIRRHPHVFGDVHVETAEDVLRNWERIKQKEAKREGKKDEGLLDGVAKDLPALAKAQAVQRKVAEVGFDWDTLEPVWQKVFEELEEIRRAETPEQRFREIGDAFFALVNLARWYNVDAESALRETVQRFMDRFREVERRLKGRGRSLGEATLEEMDAIWEEVKREELSE